jgi:transcriptional regulatory protein RtcR
VVQDEIARLKGLWKPGPPAPGGNLVRRFLDEATVATLDRFDRVQLDDVLRACSESSSLSEAGRVLFSMSRRRRATANDADRLRKYLARFGLSWQAIQERR